MKLLEMFLEFLVFYFHYNLMILWRKSWMCVEKWRRVVEQIDIGSHWSRDDQHRDHQQYQHPDDDDGYHKKSQFIPG